MARYAAGDKVLVDGTLMTLGSWPDDDAGPFHATYHTNQGGEVQGTYWASQVTTEGEPVHTSSTVALVEKGTGVESIAGDVSDLDADEPAASLSEDTEPETEEAPAA